MSDTVLVLRTCAADMSSHEGAFRWPESGPVEAPDWDPIPECGKGLHGLLWGEGKGELLCWDTDARWLVVEVAANVVVDLGGKIKFPRGVVVHCGNLSSATQYLSERAPDRAVVGRTATAGDWGTATAGYRGTATAGDQGTATAGYRGTATAGDQGTLVLRWWDGNRYRIATFYVGEDGIEANQRYRLDTKGSPTKVTP
jgi:hypothetical protein